MINSRRNELGPAFRQLNGLYRRKLQASWIDSMARAGITRSSVELATPQSKIVIKLALKVLHSLCAEDHLILIHAFFFARASFASSFAMTRDARIPSPATVVRWMAAIPLRRNSA